MVGNIHWPTFFVVFTTYCSAAFIGFFLSFAVYFKIKEQRKRKARIGNFIFEDEL